MSHTADSSKQRTTLKLLCPFIKSSKCLIGTYVRTIDLHVLYSINSRSFIFGSYFVFFCLEITNSDLNKKLLLFTDITDYLLICKLIWCDVMWCDFISFYVILLFYFILYLIIFDLIWFDLIWFDLIWCDLIWFDLIGGNDCQ